MNECTLTGPINQFAVAPSSNEFERNRCSRSLDYASGLKMHRVRVKCSTSTGDVVRYSSFAVVRCRGKTRSSVGDFFNTSICSFHLALNHLPGFRTAACRRLQHILTLHERLSELYPRTQVIPSISFHSCSKCAAIFPAIED